MHFNLYSKPSADLTYGYIQIKQQQGSQVWDDTNEVLTSGPAAYADTVVACVFDENTNSLEVTIPTALPNGTYDLIVKAAEVPSASDRALDSGHIVWRKADSGAALPFRYVSTRLIGQSYEGGLGF